MSFIDVRSTIFIYKQTTLYHYFGVDAEAAGRDSPKHAHDELTVGLGFQSYQCNIKNGTVKTKAWPLSMSYNIQRSSGFLLMHQVDPNGQVHRIVFSLKADKYPNQLNFS